MLRIERDNRGIVTLTLDRPEAKNALSAALVGAHHRVARVARGRRHGARRRADRRGRACSAPAPTSARCARRAQAPPEQNEADSRRFARMLECIERQPQPTVAIVNGAAYGGAVGLIAACDIALAGTGARFALSEVRLGLVPAMISPYVIRAIGTREARRWFLTGEAMDAATALRIGLVHETAAPATSPPARRQAILRALLAGAPGAQAEIKRLVAPRDRAQRSAGDESMLADTARWIARVRAGAEAREGLTAFLERRKPGWIRDP